MQKTKATRTRQRKSSAIQLKMEVLMRQFTKAERTAILKDCGYKESTWWGWCKYPARIPGGANKAILLALEKRHGKRYDLVELLSPVIE